MSGTKRVKPHRRMSMRTQFVIFISFFIIVYGLSNYYIALRGWQALRPVSPGAATVWLILVVVLALLFVAGRFMDGRLPYALTKTIMFAGSYWMAAWFYFFLYFGLFDLIRLLTWAAPLASFSWDPWRYPVFLAGSGLVSILVLLGSWNAWHPVVRHYDLELPRKGSTLTQLHIVAVSDIHLGWIVGKSRLEKLVENINQLDPDVVFMVGDIVDEGVNPASEGEIPATLGKLQPRLGSFAVLGNHEYISNQSDRLAPYLEAGGVLLLRDQIQKVEGFYLVGRDDRSVSGIGGRPREDLSVLLNDINPAALPVILLDHQPFNLKEAESNGVDLQISGHTHLGQLFPNHLVTEAIYENDWGYLRKGTLQILVSCGYGTWGPPIRIGNRPEILDIQIHFSP